MGLPLLLLVLTSLGFGYDFTDYVKEFNKNYATVEEYTSRKSYFDQNYSKILFDNSQNYSYTSKVNEMTDWTQAEINSKADIIQPGLDFEQTSAQVSQIPRQQLNPGK